MSGRCLTCSFCETRSPADQVRDQALRAMAKLGLVNCTKSELRGTFYRISHPACPLYQPASPAVIKARIKWQQRHHPADGAVSTESP